MQVSYKFDIVFFGLKEHDSASCDTFYDQVIYL